MTSPTFVLPAAQLEKALIQMRALRRQILAYWYATLEDAEASAIEAGSASMTVNILDEAIFEYAHREKYKKFRLNDRLGQVVTGLELIRNCETHSPVHYDDLLVERCRLSVPLNSSGAQMRSIFTWAQYGDLPSLYVELDPSATDNQKRARKEAQHGYREAIAGRVVTETLLDAVTFFERLDLRLKMDDHPELRFALAEILDSETADEESRLVIARPLGLDTKALLLPDIATRHFERRSASWAASESFFKNKIREFKKNPPIVQAREVRYLILDENDRLIGYSGVTDSASGVQATWVERKQQVWKDARAGFDYFIATPAGTVNLVAGERGGVLCAVDGAGVDHLRDLKAAADPAFDSRRLSMVETYADLYIQMRSGE